MKNLLWVGDAGVPSGFACATHHILEEVSKHFNVTVLGLNYRGDPYPYSYDIYSCMPGGDSFGVGRLIWMCDLCRPDVIVIQNDPWNIPMYMRELAATEYKDIPVVAELAFDGKNFASKWLNGVAHAIFWTQFALDEAREGGYEGSAEVIPLGVDLDVFQPMDKYEARLQAGLPREVDDAFIVGNVNRNQSRKRLDLTVRYFAEWVNQKKIDNAYLFLHIAPTGDTGCQVAPLMSYYGVLERLILSVPPTFYGDSEQKLRAIYNSFDLQVSTTQGEGFGLTFFEGLACGIPQIVPKWSALAELGEGAAWLVPCTSTIVGPPFQNVIGGVADETQFIQALHAMYTHEEWRVRNRDAGFERVRQPRYRWEHVGKAFTRSLERIVNEKTSAPSGTVLVSKEEAVV